MHTSSRRTAAGVIAAALAWTAWADDAAAPSLAARIAAAPKLAVENVATPIRGTQGGEVAWVPNPDGKTYDILLRYYNTYWGPHTTVIVDLGTGATGRHHRANALLGWGCIGPDGKLYTTRTGRTGIGFQVYDPAQNAITDLAAEVETGGEVHPLVIGPDGLLYGAGSSTDNRAQIYRLDPKTGTVDMFGSVGPSHSPNPCWGYSVGADRTHVYVASGKVPWYLVAYNRETKADAVLLTNTDPKGMINVSQGRFGCSVSYSTPASPSNNAAYWVFEGRLIDKKTQPAPPWEEPKEVLPWVASPPRPEIAGETRPKADGQVTLWVRTPDAKAQAPANPPDDASPESLGWTAIRYEVPTFPYFVHNLVSLPDGRVFGAGGSYMGNFGYDPRTGTTTHIGLLRLSQNSSTALGGKIYLSGYPSSALYEYDPEKAWTANESPRPWLKPVDEGSAASNPRRVAYLAHAGSGCHAMLAGAAADGKVYFGGRWFRNGIGGGLGWWDPREPDARKAAGGIDLPFRNFQIHFLAATADGRYVVASTKAVRDEIGGTPEPEAARLFVFDTGAGRIVRDIVPVPKARMTGPIAAVGGARVMGITYTPAEREIPGYTNTPDLTYGHMDKTSQLYLVDVESGQTIWIRTLPYPAGFRMNENARGKDGFAFKQGPDGKVWTYTGGRFDRAPGGKGWWYSYLGPDLALIRIDPKDGAIDVVGRLDRPGEIAFSGRDLILSGGCTYLPEENVWLRRIRNILPAP